MSWNFSNCNLNCFQLEHRPTSEKHFVILSGCHDESIVHTLCFALLLFWYVFYCSSFVGSSIGVQCIINLSIDFLFIELRFARLFVDIPDTNEKFFTII